jgi:hypothetical protein
VTTDIGTVQDSAVEPPQLAVSAVQTPLVSWISTVYEVMASPLSSGADQAIAILPPTASIAAVGVATTSGVVAATTEATSEYSPHPQKFSA